MLELMVAHMENNKIGSLIPWILGYIIARKYEGKTQQFFVCLF